MAPSASSGGGISLVGMVSRMGAAMRGQLYRAPANTIDGVDVTGWPSALQPIQPIAPVSSQPLGFSFWQGINQDITPRLDAPLTFQQLRNLATYPLARICIENVKDILCTMPWKIQIKRNAGEPVADWKKRQEKDDKVGFLSDCFAYPDGFTPWAEWLRPIVEDLLVIDAPSILIQRMLSGRVAGLRWTDGANILRLIDDQGFTPQGDNPAYSQLWEGIPYLLFTTSQLIYRPSNIVPRNSYSSKLYGMSCTEQLAQEISLGQERLNFRTAYYKDGVDGGLRQVIPSGIGPDRVNENMQAFASVMAGNYVNRRGLKPIQGYQPVDGARADQFVETTEPVLADIFDDYHIKEIAFGYGISSQRLVKALNRASADSSQDSSEKEGIMPRLKWLKGTIDCIIQRQMAFTEYEMVFDTDDELDAVKQATVDTQYVNSGIKTRDEVRIDRGLMPFNIPETQNPTVTIATGVTPLEGSIDRVEQAAKDASTVANRPPPKPVISAPGKKVDRDFYSGY